MKNSINICISLRKLSNQAQFTVDVGDQIFQCLINLALGIATLDFDMLAVHIELSARNGFLQVIGSGKLILSGLILLVSYYFLIKGFKNRGWYGTIY